MVRCRIRSRAYAASRRCDIDERQMHEPHMIQARHEWCRAFICPKEPLPTRDLNPLAQVGARPAAV